MSVCVCVHLSVCVCVCVYVWDLAVTFSSSRAESLLMDTKEKEDLKRRQNLSHEAGLFLDLLFLLCLHPKLLPLISPCFLCWAWFSVTISDWPTTRPKSCLRAPASPFPFTSLCADSQAQFPKFVSAFWPSSLNSSYFLWVGQSIISDLMFTVHQSCANERVACAFCFSLISWRNLVVHLLLHVCN